MKILNSFNDAIKDYHSFINNRSVVYIEHINSSIKQIEEFIDSNKDAIIDGIIVTSMLKDFYGHFSEQCDGRDNKTERISLNSNYDIYSFADNKFIIGSNITSIKVVCDYNATTGSLSKTYYMNVRYDDPVLINTDLNKLSADTLSEYNKCFENFTTNLFAKLKRTNFVSIEHDLSIKLEQFKDIIIKLKN